MSDVEHECLISVGSNIDPHRHIAMATAILEAECRLLAASTIIETAPVGYQAQPNFFNGAYLVTTALDYADFRQYLKRVEDRLGRRRGPIKSGPRTLDLDIVLWDRRVVDTDALQQDYVMVPVREVLEKSGIVLAPFTA
ncbi:MULTISPECIES: 2-amino-4-hydroxy-6-hydroxymethyldihydropteridine diphosphokinase [Modicisalibacter]|uniref:2-amino-4-hydroxy-6- hydroxymethyldihydropteridine diphosphokinase n=1 Tax=Modicisalibacter TaxID=574347 RepID=UPI00100A427C|nr:MULTISPECIES: 2-amino-4-hydroxy-6-hydroxymethyldihydropteridine diphosphokinase [Halomonadaceae]MBZ9556545.1 2-amino-4-hydroxy-6-hydroxymethyldihydropteridine diphosphokinase [Modicisalibacter sp. R2A 31.J]MBZ9574986.1 2-amino-4-hydroxy-6-hydroxymethyldihydropteridine diphosphokinase [Modicisalibacter sp. MOD 31.J]